MPHAAPKADAAVPMARNPLLWVLIQTSPRVEVLAASSNRERLRTELADLRDCDADRGHHTGCRFAIEPANILFG